MRSVSSHVMITVGEDNAENVILPPPTLQVNVSTGNSQLGTLNKEQTMPPSSNLLQRREFLTGLLAGTALLRAQWAQSRVEAQEASREIFVERAAQGTPHKGK